MNKKIVFLLFFAVFSLSWADTCTCTTCGTCTDALNNDSCGLVQLTADIADEPSTCINNPENFTNKIFDCQGHMIDGIGDNNAVYLSSKLNNTIKNCLIREFARGIYLEAESNNTNILNNTVTQCSQGGIFVAGSFYNAIMYNNASDNSGSSGIYIFGSNNNLIANNTANSNLRGIHLDSGSENNLIENNTVYNNTEDGFYLDSDSNNNNLTDNTAYNNQQWDINITDSAGNVFINQTLAGDSLTTYPTVISFTYTGDVSLKGVSTPPEDPANYINITKYVNATGTGTLFLNFSYSDGDLGSIAEASLRVSRNNGAWETDPSVFATTYGVDTTNNIVYADINNFGSVFAPLGQEALCTCTTCGTCTDALNNDSCGLVQLTADIVDEPSTCINNPKNFTNKIFDCQGHTIDGDSYNGSGINLNVPGKQNNIIRNCIITDFNYGIYLAYSTNITIINNSIHSNNVSGIYVFWSQKNNITENNVSSNVWWGIYLSSSSSNTITNNTVELNREGIYILTSSNNNRLIDNNVNFNNGITVWGFGIYMDSSSNNTLINNNVSSNIHYGIYLESSSNNTLYNNVAYNNSRRGFSLSSSSNNTLYNNVAYNNSQHGFLLSNAANNTLSGNDAYMNGFAGFMLLDNSNFNTLINNNASSNTWGIHLSGSNYNNITDNVAYNNTGSVYSSGIYIYPDSNNTLLINNVVYENTNGIYVWRSHNNTLISNNAYNNSRYGFMIDSGRYNNLTNNHAYENDLHGVVVSFSDYNNFENNFVYDNSKHGFYIYDDSDGNRYLNNTAYNNQQWDINITDSAGNVFINQTLAGDSLTTYPTVISFTYTGDVSLKGVSTPPEDPANYINITKYVNATGTGTLFLNFSYSDAELGDVEEISLRVSRYNGTWLTNPAFFASEAGVHLLYNFVYVNINNFGSIFAPLGKNNTAPSIDLDEPANNTQINNTHTVTFTFTASDDFSTTLNCSLYLNDTLTQTNESVQNNILTPFVITGLEYGDYTWYINCSDGVLINVSETRNFSLRDTLPPVITIVNPSNNAQLPAGTTFVLVEIATNENATCEYNISGDFVFGTGSLFNETGNTTHILNFTNLTNGTTYTLYYRCSDTYGNIGGPVIHVFRVASPRRPGGGGGGGDHELYIFPINNQYSKLGETINVLFTVENTGDYSETNVRLTLTCPSSFSCGSATLGTIAEGGKKNASIPITGNSLGTFTLRVYANSEDASAYREFLFTVSPECTKDSECGADERCMNSRCVEKEEVSGCERNTDCEEDEKCVDGRCVEIVCECGEVKNHECVPYECCSDNECFGGKVCVSNKCVEPTPPKEEGKPSEGAPSQKPTKKPPSEEAKGEEQKPPAGGGQPPANWIWILLILLGVVILGAVYFLMAKKRR